ncbi:OB-fold protein [Archangium lansingense]|uniref:OB-fold protein n=1 Tax=Archangium lansingense TaxID=2995310 RepID=UPI003B786716
MALVRCKQCGGDVASNAASCPKCGAPPPRGIRLGRLFGIALIVTVCFVAWVMAQVPDGDGASPAAARRMPDAKQVEIHKLLAEYTDNEVRADASFKGKLIQTTGVVDDVKRDVLNTVYVVVGTGKRYEVRMLQCFIDEDNANTVASLTKGSRVTIRGRVKGLMMNVLVEDCELVNL